MPQIKKHVFVCLQNRPLGHPRGSCSAKGGASIYQLFVAEFNKREIWERFRLTNTGCLGPCPQGATVVVYPDGVMYGHVTADDVSAIIDQHLEDGTPVRHLAIANW